MISCRQLLDAGFTHRRIHLRVRRGELIRRHHGVYQVAGAPYGFRARMWAALLACGPSAFASHWTAAVCWAMRRREPEVIDVTMVGSRAPGLQGVRIHRLQALPAGQLRTRSGVRLSAPSRVICELAATVAREDVEYAIQEAAARRLLNPDELRIAAAGWGGRPGARMLRAILQSDGNVEFSRSWAERRLRRIVDRAGLPRPAQNVQVLRYRVDALWPGERLIVEVDGIGTHGTAVAFAADRAMDAELVAAGWRVLRFTAHQLKHEPMLVATRIAQALALRA
jgi:very-short-patch-repair endonuclease